MNRKMFGVAVIGVMLASFSGLFCKMAMNDGNDSLQVLFWRFAFSAIILLPVNLIGKIIERKHVIKGQEVFYEKRSNLNRKRIGAVMLVAGLLFGIHFSFFYLSFQYVSTLLATILVGLQVIFSALYESIFFKFHIKMRAYIGVTVAFTGVLVTVLENIGNKEEHSSLIGILFAILAAMIGPLYMSCTRYLGKSAPEISTGMYMNVLMIFGAGTVILIESIRGQNVFNISMYGLGMGLLLAVVCQCLGVSLQNWSLKYISTIDLNTAVLSESIFLALWNFILFSQIPSLYTVVGGTMICLGIWYFIKSETGMQSVHDNYNP